MTKKARKSVSLNMTGVVPASTDDAALDALLADLGLPEGDADEVFESAPETEAIEPTADAMDLEAAVASVEVREIQAAQGDEFAESEVPTELIEPEGSVSGDEPAAAPEKKGKRAKGEKKAKAPKEPKVAKPKAEKPPKEPKAPRVYYADKVDRIVARLGDKLGDFMVLEVADAALEGEALKAKQDETLAILRGMSVKVKNRASLLLDYAAGKTGSLNEVITRAFKVLAADGKLETGDKGNLHLNLLAKPYSQGAASAMGRNTINLMAALKVINKTDKGVFVANPESLLLSIVNGKLGIGG